MKKFDAWVRLSVPAKWAVALVIILVMGLVGYVGGRSSATVDKNCTYDPGQQCTIDAAHWSKRRFNHDKMGRTDGVPKQMWARPKAARKVFVAKFERYLHSHPNYTPKVSNARRTDLCFYAQDPEHCRANLMYRDVMQNSTCAHYLKYRPYSANTLVCDSSWTDDVHITQNQVKRYGTVIVCGGALAVAVAGAPETGGGSLVAAAGAGSVSCFWGSMIGSS